MYKGIKIEPYQPLSQQSTESLDINNNFIGKHRENLLDKTIKCLVEVIKTLTEL